MKTGYSIILSLIYTVLLPHIPMAQTPQNTDIGDIPLEQLKMTSFEADPSAGAVVLFDLGRLWHNGTTQENLFQKHIRIKILHEEASDVADIVIPYFGDSWKSSFAGFEATSYTLENGSVVKSEVKKSEVFDEEINGPLRAIRFAIPNAKAGSVIELHYRKRLEFYQAPDWVFQSRYPVMWSEFEISLPPTFKFQPYFQGYTSLLVNENELGASERRRSEVDRAFGKSFKNSGFEYMRTFSRWVAKDIPAFKADDYVAAPTDYMTQMRIFLLEARVSQRTSRSNQLVLTQGGQRSTPYNVRTTTYTGGDRPLEGWPQMQQKLMDNERFGKQLKPNKALEAIAETILSATDDDNERIKMAFTKVQELIKWDGDYSKWSYEGIAKAISNGTGNSADMNLALVSLLRQMDYSASPVVVALRKRGRPSPIYPILSDYHTVVSHVALNGKDILMDPSQSLYPYNELPPELMSGMGKLVNETTINDMQLRQREKESTYLVSQLEVKGSGRVEGFASRTLKSYPAATYRRKKQEKSEQEFAAQVRKFYKDFEIADLQIVGDESQHSPVKESVNLSSDEYTTAAADKIYMPGIAFGALYSNPFLSETRLYPLDYEATIDQTMIFQYTIPEGYTIEESPEPALIRLPDNSASYVYHLVVNGNTVQITSKLNINKTLFFPEEYKQLRSFYDQVVSKQAEQIVLVKSE